MNYRKKNKKIKKKWALTQNKAEQAQFLLDEICRCKEKCVNGEWQYDKYPKELTFALFGYLWKEVKENERNSGCSAEEDRSGAVL